MNVTARHLFSQQVVNVSVTGEVISAIEPLTTAPSGDLPWIAPGLFDLQINGYGGIWFSDESLTVDNCLKTLAAHYQYGITQLFPTLITNSFEALENGFSVIRQACEAEPWADRMVLGCHLEGPYISAEDGPRGAHPLDQVRPCDWTEVARLQAASGNRIRLLTLAPESPGAPEFTRQAVQTGITIAIGHTAATTEQIEAAVDAGATLSTHLGNGAHGTLRRHPNYIWDQLGEPRLTASIIADGQHLPPSVVRSFYFAKGKDRIVLTCDASGLAGLPPGEYDYHGGKFEVLAEGKIVVAGQRQYLAGSAVQTDICVGEMVRMTGCSLADAWEMASINPARLTNVHPARIEVGATADFVLFRFDEATSRLSIDSTVAAGKSVFERN